MLFSHEEVAAFINDNFEAAWENVRAVPIVTIDFGGGHVLTRTLNGNIATYVCNSDGTWLDILPGIYEPRTYQQQLAQFVKLHQWVKQSHDVTASLADYHRRQAEALAQGQPPLVFEAPLSMTKLRIEKSTKLVLSPGSPPVTESSESATDDSDSNEDVAGWNVLAEDTRVNESLRRRAIHERFAGDSQLLKPSQVTKWLYRNILNADLDDPYLGLGKTLFTDYPFNDHE